MSSDFRSRSTTNFKQLKYRLGWLSSDCFEQSMNQLVISAKLSINNARKKRAANVIDPFSSLLIASSFNIEDPATLDSLQNAESALRGMSNALGGFHQSILGSIDGWDNHDAGYDLECESQKIIAEVKNKHNTMNTANRREVENELKTALRQKKGDWTAYLVQIIPKKPVRETNHLSTNLYVVDGASFYHLASGRVNALHELFDAMCAYLSPSDEICEHCKSVMASSLPPRE